MGDFQTAHRQWVEQTLESRRTVRDDRWSEAIAADLVFVETVKSGLGGSAIHRGFEQKGGAYALREHEAHNGDFSGKVTLKAQHQSFGTETLQLRRHSTVRPGTKRSDIVSGEVYGQC